MLLLKQVVMLRPQIGEPILCWHPLCVRGALPSGRGRILHLITTTGSLASSALWQGSRGLGLGSRGPLLLGKGGRVPLLTTGTGPLLLRGAVHQLPLLVLGLGIPRPVYTGQLDGFFKVLKVSLVTSANGKFGAWWNASRTSNIVVVHAMRSNNMKFEK